MCSSHLGSRVIRASVSCMPSKGDYPTPRRFRQLVSFALTRIIRSGEYRESPPYPAGNPEPRYDLEHIAVVLTHFVIAGHSASEDARERACDPAIHPLRKKFLRRMMDPRVKPAGDGAPHPDVRSAQRAQVPPQAIGAGTWNEAFDLAMRSPPDRNRARKQCAARGRQLQPAAASVMGVDHHRDEAAPLQRLERGGERGAVHGEQRRD